jgi:two-component system, OmpR family, sensor kinase
VRPLRAAMAGLRRRPVRVRLAIFSGLLTAVILIVFALVVGRLVTNRIETDFRDELQGTANGLAVALANNSGAAVSRTDLTQIALANDAEIRIVDRSGATRFETIGAPDLGDPEPGKIEAVGDTLRVATQQIPQVSLGSTTPAYVQYAQSRADIDATIDRLWLFLGGGVAIGTLLAVLAGMTVANRAMQPISSLTGTARTIARTRDPSMRITEPESDDEVAELARTLDGMLRELDAARTETELTIQRQREFVADASHELRTPLTSVLANLELLEASLPASDEDGQAATRSALRSSKRMGRLVGDLLILARADAGRRDEPVRCDLSRIAREVCEEVRAFASEHRLEDDIDADAQLTGDPDGLHRMLLNLLENAIRHTPAGTTIQLRLDRDADSDEAEIEVSDDGPGLPEGMEEQVFERFVRGSGPADRQSGDGDGTGLGLSIVRAVAAAHGGTVTPGASPAGGARFVIRLPLEGSESD